MEPGIIPGIHIRVYAPEIAMGLLQWSPGLLPGYTSSIADCGMFQAALQWSPESLPGYTTAVWTGQYGWSCFNGARDHSRDTPVRGCARHGPVQASMEPGITPGIHGPAPKEKPHNQASMEPGITPGIHWEGIRSSNSHNSLQWSPELLPGYTSGHPGISGMSPYFNGARNYSRDTPLRTRSSATAMSYFNGARNYSRDTLLPVFTKA